MDSGLHSSLGNTRSSSSSLGTKKTQDNKELVTRTLYSSIILTILVSVENAFSEEFGSNGEQGNSPSLKKCSGSY